MTDTASAPATTDEADRLIPLDQLHPSPQNLRSKLGDLRELTASVKAVGILQALTVRPREDGGYEVVIGHRRLAAAEKAGLDTAPCIVRELTDDQRDEIMLIENLQRVDLNPVEEARGYFRLIEGGMTLRTLAARIGRTQKHVSGRLALLDLPAAVLAHVEAGDIPLGQAPALRGLYDEDLTIDDEVRDQVVERVMEGADAERLVETAAADARYESLLAKVVDKVEARGLPYAVQRGYGLPAEAAGWKIIGDGYEQLPVEDVKAHDRLDCARLLVQARGHTKPAVVRACADPKSHTTKRAEKDGGLKDADYERRRQERERTRAERAAQREQATRLRRQQGRALAGMKRREAVEILTRYAIGTLAQADWQGVARILDLEPEIRENAWGATNKDGSPRMEKDWMTPVTAYATQSGAAALRVAVAAAMVRPPWIGDEALSTRTALDALVSQFSDEPDPDPDQDEASAA